MTKRISWLIYVIVFVYQFSMVILPVFQLQSWQSILEHWQKWQGLNTGFLAFVTSFVVYKLAVYNTESQRERNFIAARAFLSSALSQIMNNLSNAVPILLEAWARSNDPNDNCKSPLKTDFIADQEDYKPVFKDCIVNATPSIGKYLAEILGKLQVHNARLFSLQKEFSPNSQMTPHRQNIESYLFAVAEIYCLVENLFSLARCEVDELEKTQVTTEDIESAFRKLDIQISRQEELILHARNIIKARY